MSGFVLDCSVTMGWCFESEADRYTVTVLETLATGSAIAPAVWPLEVANVLLVAERRRRVTRADAARFLELLASLPVAVERTDDLDVLPALLGLGREHRLSPYDASYLHLAMREQLPLATRDAALRAAARAVGVGWFVPNPSARHATEDEDASYTMPPGRRPPRRRTANP